MCGIRVPELVGVQLRTREKGKKESQPVPTPSVEVIPWLSHSHVRIQHVFWSVDGRSNSHIHNAHHEIGQSGLGTVTVKMKALAYLSDL